jgi:hypothetical protein
VRHQKAGSIEYARIYVAQWIHRSDRPARGIVRRRVAVARGLWLH